MQFKLRTLFLVVLLAAIATPVSIRIYRHFDPRPFFVGPTVFLCGTIGTDAITNEHIRNLLASTGINSVAEGIRKIRCASHRDFWRGAGGGYVVGIRRDRCASHRDYFKELL